MNSLKLSVVIGTYNQKDKLKQVIESLLHQTLPLSLYEIIIVDSSSTDVTDKMVEEFLKRPNNIKYIKQENFGRPGARNRGVTESVGEIIFLTDADMLADTFILEEHLKAHANHKNASFEGLTINPDKKPYIKEKLKSGQKIRWSYFLTGNLSIRKDTIVKAGMFDLDFSGYGWEDIELGYRLNKAKIPLYYLPEAINYHMHPVTQDEMFKRKYQMGESAAIFYRKHPNIWIKLFLGMNPLAQVIYKLIKNFPKLQDYVGLKSETSFFYKYLWEEFLYRKGFEEILSK